MTICYSLFVFFASLSIFSAIFVVFTKNPVFSVLFLILAFVNVAGFLFLFHFEFLPVSFIVIYVGAIAVLFIFVLIMLNLKHASLTKNDLHLLPFSIFFGAFFFLELLYLVKFNFVLIEMSKPSSVFFLVDFLNVFSLKFDFFHFSHLSSNVQQISSALFSEFLLNFTLAAYILLVAMIGTITITLKKH